jgi:hypothetical protein
MSTRADDYVADVKAAPYNGELRGRDQRRDLALKHYDTETGANGLYGGLHPRMVTLPDDRSIPTS